MWYIIWNIDSQVKHDVLGFDTESQAVKYANYYKSLLEVYHDGKHMQKRFAASHQSQNKDRIRVSFQLTKRKSS